MPPHPLNDAKHWRMRVAEMRATASGNDDVEAARIMNRLADDSDKLAARAEQRTASGLKSLPSAMSKEKLR